jgi:hypothetical protein
MKNGEWRMENGIVRANERGNRGRKQAFGHCKPFDSDGFGGDGGCGI